MWPSLRGRGTSSSSFTTSRLRNCAQLCRDQARCGLGASAARAADWPRLLEALGSPRHALALRAASGDRASWPTAAPPCCHHRCKAMSLLASKPAYWFPKLSVGVGRRTWSYDGEPEETYDAIIQNAAGGAAAPHPLACFPATPAYHASLPCLPAMPPCHAANLSDCAPGTTSMRRPCHASLPCGGPL